jgi:DNA polymerase I-like protein with 3'-5' exonuclease and polymerase domains
MQVVNQESEKTKVKVDLRTAEQLVKAYYDEFFLVLEWHRRVQSKLAKDRTLTNPFGRKRIFFGRWGEELFRVAYSWEPQSTVADRLNTSLVRIDREMPKVQLLVQVHDALVAEINEADLDEVVPQMKELMEEPFEINGDLIKIPAEFKWGRNWGGQSESNPEGMRKYQKAS